MKNHSKLLNTVAAMVAIFLTTSASAGPAPWYMWRSLLDGKQVCMQTSPGKGWERLSGPYTTHRC